MNILFQRSLNMELGIEFWIGISLTLFMFVMLVVVLPLKLGMKELVLAFWGLKPFKHHEYKPPQTLTKD